jgi:hypothetical protein
MLIFLIPFNIKIEQIKGGLLREGNFLDLGRLGALALFNEVTEFDT